MSIPLLPFGQLPLCEDRGTILCSCVSRTLYVEESSRKARIASSAPEQSAQISLVCVSIVRWAWCRALRTVFQQSLCCMYSCLSTQLRRIVLCMDSFSPNCFLRLEEHPSGPQMTPDRLLAGWVAGFSGLFVMKKPAAILVLDKGTRTWVNIGSQHVTDPEDQKK